VTVIEGLYEKLFTALFPDMAETFGCEYKARRTLTIG
jgi:hypothetical protein